MRTDRGEQIPIEAYHGVPAGWTSEEVIAAHARLDPTHELRVSEVGEPGAPAWLPCRSAWLRYRAALYEVANGVTAGDPACVELAVRYIVLRYIGSYSGFIREKLARRLASAELSVEQKARLHDHFEALVCRGERTQEFRAFAKLWRRTITPSEQKELLARVRRNRGDGAAEWLSKQLDPTTGVA